MLLHFKTESGEIWKYESEPCIDYLRWKQFHCLNEIESFITQLRQKLKFNRMQTTLTLRPQGSVRLFTDVITRNHKRRENICHCVTERFVTLKVSTKDSPANLFAIYGDWKFGFSRMFYAPFLNLNQQISFVDKTKLLEPRLTKQWTSIRWTVSDQDSNAHNFHYFESLAK